MSTPPMPQSSALWGRVQRCLPFAGIALLVMSVWLLGTAQRQTVHFGDDQEYLTMATSFIRHGSPDFRPGDDLAMLAALPRSWVRSLGKKFHPGSPPYAYYLSRDGKYFGWHFFAYPALVAPLRWLLDARPDAARAHQDTNLICFCLALLSLLQLRARPRLFWLLLPMVFLTPVLWFLPYAHTETFVFSLGIVAVTCYLSDRPLLAILCNSIAATQYQPVALVSIFICIEWTWRQFSQLRQSHVSDVLSRWPKALAVLAATSIVFIPSLFFYVHFGVPNLVARESLVSTRLMSFDKFAWMFIDPNGGMLAYTPGLLWLLLAAAFWAGQRALRERNFWGLGLLSCALLTMFGSTVQRNWNHPTFGVSRYVLYGIAPMLLFIGNELRLMPASRTTQLLAVVSVAIGLQLLAHRVHGVFEYQGRDSGHHSDFALYVLERWPALYSPPAIIFCGRTLGKCMTDVVSGEPLPEYLPAIWQDRQGRPRKVLAAGCDPEPVLRARAWSATEIAKIRSGLHDCRGPGPKYINL